MWETIWSDHVMPRKGEYRVVVKESGTELLNADVSSFSEVTFELQRER